MSVPFQSTRPALGLVIVARMRISVDLPAPFGPSSPSTPGLSSSRKVRKACHVSAIGFADVVNLELHERPSAAYVRLHAQHAICGALSWRFSSLRPRCRIEIRPISLNPGLAERPVDLGPTHWRHRL